MLLICRLDHWDTPNLSTFAYARPSPLAFGIQHRLFGSQPYLQLVPIVSFEDGLEADRRSTASHSEFCMWAGLCVYARFPFAVSWPKDPLHT